MSNIKETLRTLETCAVVLAQNDRIRVQVKASHSQTGKAHFLTSSWQNTDLGFTRANKWAMELDRSYKAGTFDY